MLSAGEGLECRIEAWLCESLARACRADPDAVTRVTATLDLGLDSLTLVAVLSQVEMLCDVELAEQDVLPLLDAETVGELSDRLTGILRSGL